MMDLNETIFSTANMGSNSSSQLIDDRPADDVFRVSPKVYNDPALFELELENIFKRTWIFLGIAGDMPNANDFLTSKIGRVPVLVTRAKDGSIRAFQNVCRHRGAVVCKGERGNTPVHVCPYHNWSYATDGRLLGVKDKEKGHYAEGFFEGKGLQELPRVECHRDLIFGSLSPDVPTLGEFLGDARYFIDLVLDQAPNGIESIPGRTPYYFRANWKLQAENGLDVYHVTSTHTSMIAIARRKQEVSTARSETFRNRFEDIDQMFNLRHGHAALLNEPNEIENLPFYPSIDALRARLGEARVREMVSTIQLHIFPNLQIATSVVPIIRKFQPIGVAETAMEVSCIGAIGESARERNIRLRQYEDFFNASGLATPDDSIVYEDVQNGTNGDLDYFYGYTRGITKLVQGANDFAHKIGISPDQSITATGQEAPETMLHSPHREWLRMLRAAAAGEKAYA